MAKKQAEIIRQKILNEIEKKLNSEEYKTSDLKDLSTVLRHLSDLETARQQMKILKLNEKKLAAIIDNLTASRADGLQNIEITGSDFIAWRLQTTLDEIKRIKELPKLSSDA